MEYLVTALAAFAAAVLTLFSGFGLGTVLAPVFALFFPLPVAVAATAVVHLANNLVNLALLGRAADWAVVRRFGVPAALAAMPGALVLVAVAGLEPVYRYALGGREFAVVPVGLTLGLLIVVFALLELSPAFAAAAGPVASATLEATLGAVVGTRLLGKVTLRTVQLTVAAGMATIGAGLALGWL